MAYIMQGFYVRWFFISIGLTFYPIEIIYKNLGVPKGMEHGTFSLTTNPQDDCNEAQADWVMGHIDLLHAQGRLRELIKQGE